VHYYNEIVRYWNKLNYIVKKTLRSIHFKEELDNLVNALLLYLTYRVRFENASIEELRRELSKEFFKNPVYSDFMEKIPTFSWKRALEDKGNVEKFSLMNAIPNFFISRLMPVMSLDQIKENHETMNDIKKTKSFTVHVSRDIEKTLNLCFINNLQAELNRDKQILKKDPHIKHLYSVPMEYKKELISSELYKNGDIIAVNKGSAAVIHVLNPKPNETIGDLCAAPGIKTYLMTQEKSRVIAGDFHLERTKTMNSMLNKLSKNQIPIINTDSIQFPIREGVQFDKILLDAPCTGSGTFLNNPELKWRQNRRFLHQNVVLQEKLLKSALDLLKSKGVLVYSTCSLYPNEGEQQIKKILERLKPLKLPKWFSPSYPIDGLTIPGTGRLFPAIHRTQGFFIGKFKKKW